MCLTVSVTEVAPTPAVSGPAQPPPPRGPHSASSRHSSDWEHLGFTSIYSVSRRGPPVTSSLLCVILAYSTYSTSGEQRPCTPRGVMLSVGSFPHWLMMRNLGGSACTFSSCRQSGVFDVVLLPWPGIPTARLPSCPLRGRQAPREQGKPRGSRGGELCLAWPLAGGKAAGD